MAKGYRPVERDQQFLLAPDMADWLPDGHLVWFLTEVIAELDTGVLHARAARRRDGAVARSAAGRAGYDPDMLLLVLIYAYACGERSSRRIERLCTTDVAFRIACAGDIPDHTVLARFRQHHAEAFAGLFAQVLRLCREAGLVKLATVAIDGTKIAANASLGANRGEEALRVEAERLDQEAAARAAADQETAQRIVSEAAAVDGAEDAEFGAGRGDELPRGWDSRGVERRERIRIALGQFDAARHAERDARAARDAQRARADREALAAAETALATEIATRQARRDEWEQAWERAMAVPGARLPHGRAPVPPEESKVVARAHDRVAKARARVADPETAPRPGGRTPDPDRRGRRDLHPEPRANTTDPDSRIMPTRRGWVQGFNVQIAATADQIILATMVSANPADLVAYTPMTAAAAAAAAAIGDPDGIGTLLFDAGYVSEATLPDPVGDPGPDRLIALGRTRSVRAAARHRPASGAPPLGATRREAMDHRLRTPEGAALYKRRGATVEPAIGNLKKLLDRFSRRGLTAASSEIDLAATAFNLLKIHRAATT